MDQIINILLIIKEFISQDIKKTKYNINPVNKWKRWISKYMTKN
jgi:hypothetical protein